MHPSSFLMLFLFENSVCDYQVELGAEGLKKLPFELHFSTPYLPTPGHSSASFPSLALESPAIINISLL